MWMAGIMQVTDKLYHISWSKSTSSQAKVKLMTLAVIDTDCIGRGKSTVWSLPGQAFHIENFYNYALYIYRGKQNLWSYLKYQNYR